MIGTYQHTIDAKGRIFIPARLKEELGDTFYVTISMEKCLTAYSNESWDLIMEKFRARKKSEQVKLRPLFAHANKCEPDAQGRVLIPQKLRDFAGLDKNVAIVGMGEYAELWDADAWAAVEAIETTPEYMADVFTELDF